MLGWLQGQGCFFKPHGEIYPGNQIPLALTHWGMSPIAWWKDQREEKLNATCLHHKNDNKKLKHASNGAGPQCTSQVSTPKRD